jgi:8-oxo-dGTP diphosphatase
MVLRGDEVLLGRRKGSHGEGTFGWPGGGLEFGESLADAVRREALEESGLHVEEFELLCISNVVEYERHYLDLEFKVTKFTGTPSVREPDAIESWNWYKLDALPGPLFRPCQLAIETLKTARLLNDS